MTKRKKESAIAIVAYFLFFAGIIIGLTTGCAFEDVDIAPEEAILAGCAITAVLIIAYCLKCVAQHFTDADEEETANIEAAIGTL